MNRQKLLKPFQDNLCSSAGEQLHTGCEVLTKQLQGVEKSTPFLLSEKTPKAPPLLNGNKTCDISRKNKKFIAPEKDAQLSRSVLYNLRFKAGDIVGGRTARCGCVAGFDEKREIAIMQKENNFYLSGVETCSSVWACPVCALKISQKRAEQVREILTWSQSREGFSHGFLTLTTRHNNTEHCKDVKKRVLDAWRKVTQMRKYKEFGAETIRALEVKYNLTNGWHPHLHIAIIAEKNETELKNFVYSFIIPTYLKIVGCETLAANQKYKPIYAGAGVSDYITKWDLSLELTHAQSKIEQSNSFTPFAMLKELIKPEPHYKDLEANHLRVVCEMAFKEYAKTFKGAKQLTISRKLKEKFIEFDLITDEDITNEVQEAAEIKVKISRPLFGEIASIRVQADVINAFQEGGIALLQVQLMEFGIQCEYDPENNMLISKQVFRGWGDLPINYKFIPDKPPKQEKFQLDFE